MEYFKNKRITKVVCGGYHTLALTEENELYGFGKGNFGQCGYGEFEDTNLPRQVIFSKKLEMFENVIFFFILALLRQERYKSFFVHYKGY